MLEIVKDKKQKAVKEKTPEEVTTTKEFSVYRNDLVERKYFKFYCDDIVNFTRQPIGESSVLYALLQYALSKNIWDNTIDLNLRVRKLLAKNSGVSVPVFNNLLTKLAKRKIISPPSQGSIILNPKYFGRGELFNIKRIEQKYQSEVSDFTITYTYSDKGREIKINL